MHWILEIAEKRQETPTVVSLIFNKPNDFSYKAGQFLRWTFPEENMDKRGPHRVFTLASSPTEPFLMVTTRIGPTSVKQHIEKVYTTGTKVQISAPLGKMQLVSSEDPLIMIAGGIGITPLRSIIKYMMDTNTMRNTTLLFSNQTPEEIPYKNELDTWLKRHTELKIIHTITRPQQTSHPWHDRIGRIDEAMIRENTTYPEKTQYYVCGPIMMVKTIIETLKTINIPRDHIHSEIFTGY